MKCKALTDHRLQGSDGPEIGRGGPKDNKPVTLYVPPNGGTMRVRIGITAPLALASAAAGEIAWPWFVERNFNIPEPLRHALWMEGKGQLEPGSPALHAEEPKPGIVAVRGLVREPDLTSGATRVRVLRDRQIRQVWSTEPRSNARGFVQGTIVETKVAAPSRLVLVVDGLSAIQSLPSRGTVTEDLERLFASWRSGGREVRLVFEHLDAAPSGEAAAHEASLHLTRLWAAEQARWLQASRRANEAVALAAAYQLVTPLSGAVVLETEQQYAQHDLTPADPTRVPAIPEPGARSLLILGLAFLLRRRHNLRLSPR